MVELDLSKFDTCRHGGRVREQPHHCTGHRRLPAAHRVAQDGAGLPSRREARGLPLCNGSHPAAERPGHCRGNQSDSDLDPGRVEGWKRRMSVLTFRVAKMYLYYGCQTQRERSGRFVAASVCGNVSPEFVQRFLGGQSDG